MANVFKNAKYEVNGSITVDLKLPNSDRWIPFSACADDPDDFNRDLFHEILASGVPIEDYVPATEPVARKMVAKSTVQQRIIAKNKMGEAYNILTSNPVAFARWFAPNHPSVYCDDPDAIGIVVALGLDPFEILAPEQG